MTASLVISEEVSREYYVVLRQMSGIEQCMVDIATQMSGAPQGFYNIGVCYYNGSGGLVKSNEEAAKWFLRSAALGKPEAQNHYAIMVRNGMGVGRDDALAFFWFEKAAQQGHAIGQFFTGMALLYGTGTAIDAEQAVEWLKKAQAGGNEDAARLLQTATPILGNLEKATREAEAGVAEGQYLLGCALLNGTAGVVKDETRGEELLGLAVQQGHAGAQFRLGEHYYYRGAESNNRFKGTSRGVPLFIAAAAQGHVEAQVTLGDVYSRGMAGVTRDVATAIRYYRPAAQAGSGRAREEMQQLGREMAKAKRVRRKAESGDSWCMYQLGMYLSKGTGVNQNEAEAVSWLEKSAALNLSFAQHELALRFQEGEGVEANREEALRLCTLAADQKLYAAMFTLAEWHFYGADAPRDFTRCRTLLEGIQHHSPGDKPVALYYLGWIYQRGLDVPADQAKAMGLYKRGATRGCVACMYELAEALWFGLGELAQDKTEAVRLLDVSIERRLPRAMSFKAAILVETNAVEAVALARRAISYGENDLMAHRVLAHCYHAGKGVEVQLLEAVRHYRQAGELGDPASCKQLSEMYATGEGVEVSADESAYWLAQATELGYQEPSSTPHS